MLSVIFVSRCEDAALSRTKEILDAYAIRIGDKTWRADITSEGLDTVRKALRLKASRRMSVACHVITRQGHLLAWIVGSPRRFSRSGASPVRTTRAIHSSLKTRRQFSGYPLVSALAQAAALGHDFGKANKFFQDKVKKGAKEADPFRHEFLSALIVNYLESDNFSEAFEKAGQDAKSLKPSSIFPLEFPSTTSDKNLLVQWLIATHHRLPARDDNNSCKWHISDSEDAGRIKSTTKAGNIVTANAGAFIQAVANLPIVPEDAIMAAFVWSRLALMLGDHYASADCTIAQADKAELVANSTCKQELGAHLFGVAKAAVRAAREIVVLTNRLPALYPSDRKEVERPAPRSGDYAWQNDLAAKAALIAGDQDSVNRGTFAVLCADTGTGKTRGALRLASILCGENMRVSLLLGLRTLTLQAGDAYIKDFKVPSEAVSVLIGSKEIRKLHHAANHNNDAVEKLDDDFDPIIFGGQDYAGILPKILDHKCKRIDDQKLVCAPILVSTIDYVIGAGSWSRSHYLLPMLRVLSADIILDEIDSYDLNDYPAISRLCFLAGLFGRRVILSSATTMPEIFAPLFEAYQKGWQSYSALAGIRNQVDVLFSADCVPTERHIVNSCAPAIEAYTEFANRVAQALRQKLILRRGSILPIDETKYKDLRRALCPVIWRLHKDNSVVTASGKHVSAGLIRMAHTQEALDFAVKLAGAHDKYRNLPEKTYVKVILYHSAMPLAVRNHIERILDNCLVRKAGGDRFLESSFVADVEKSDCQYGMLIVVATPVEEVGRDHDFDWAIIEPSSTRSIAQCAGRVRRHRRSHALEEDKTNIAVLSHPLMSFRNSGDTIAYRYPGFESATFRFENHDTTCIAPQTAALPGAASCLEKLPGEYLPRVERASIKSSLKDKISNHLGKSYCMTSFHSDKYRFRTGAETKLIFADPREKYWLDTDDFGRSKVISSHHGIEQMEFQAESNGFFIEPSWAKCLEISIQTASLVGSVLDEKFFEQYLSVPVRSNLFKKVAGDVLFNPILGVARKREK